MNHRIYLSRRSALFAVVGGVSATLSLLLGLGSEVRADVPDGPARPGEIVLKVAAGMGDEDAKALAAKVNFEVSGPIPYAPGYYRLVQKTRSVPLSVSPVFVKGRKGRAADVSVVHFTAEFKQAVETLRAIPGVLADPNYIRLLHQTGSSTTTLEPNDPYYPAGNIVSSAGQAWHYGLINMPQAWAVQSNGANRTILAGVIDTGIDPGHPDLVNRISPLSRDFSGRDAAGNVVVSTTLTDTNGHGTHTGGTVGAETNNSLGVAGIGGWNQDGVDIRIVALRGGVDNFAADALIAAYSYAGANNLDVVNMSLGGPFNVPTEHAAITAAYKLGVTFVASAGNSGVDDTGNPDPVGGQVPNYPASYPEVINVSAVGPEKTLAFYSSYGSNVAITAPGGSDPTFSKPERMVISTYPRNHTSAYDTAPSPVDGYSADQGTSMAAPHVTGVVALLLACGAPRDPALIKQILQSTAQALPDESPSLSGGKYGAGLVDAYAAILPYANPPFSVAIPGAVSASVQQGISTSSLAILAGDLPYTNRGTTYSAAQAPLVISTRGVSRKATTDSVTVELQTATTPSTTLRVFTAGDSGPNGFDIPALPSGSPKATTFNVQVPRDPSVSPITVPDGRYKFVLKLNGVTQGITFFEKVSRSQPLGRALFSTPFQVRQVDSTTPEQTLFGTGTTFSLARYNPLRLPSDFDYALFQSGSTGRTDAAARFSASALNGLPLSFDTTNPSVSIAPVGLGYWLRLDSSVILNTSGSVVTNAVGVRCYAANGGWNMIGAPFTFPVSFGTVTVVASNGQTYSLTDAVSQGIVSSALVSFVNGDYQYAIAPAGTLEPFNGYWVRVFQDCTLIIAPAASTGAGRAVGAAGTASSTATTSPIASGWKVRLSAAVDGDRDGQNFFGQVRSTASKTRFALPKPPSGAGHAYVRFVDVDSNAKSRATEASSGAFAFDLRPAAPGTEGNGHETWTAQVSTDRPDTDVVLTWDGLGTAPRRAGLFLTDDATGRKISLRDRSSYTYRSGVAGSTRSFTISMEPTRSSGPLAIHNLSVSSFGKAMGGGVAVRFSTTRDADVTGIVKTLSGQVVGALSGTSRAVASSTTQLRWTGRAQNGAALPAGAYLLEVTVRDADGNTATAKQTVQSLR